MESISCKIEIKTQSKSKTNDLTLRISHVLSHNREPAPNAHPHSTTVPPYHQILLPASLLHNPQFPCVTVRRLPSRQQRGRIDPCRHAAQLRVLLRAPASAAASGAGPRQARQPEKPTRKSNHSTLAHASFLCNAAVLCQTGGGRHKRLRSPPLSLQLFCQNSAFKAKSCAGEVARCFGN